MSVVNGVAHRGYPAAFPENTLSGFQAAVDLGYSIVEFDVQLSKDGIPIIMHDLEVNRVTDGNGPVRELTLKQLKELRVGGTEEIPTLLEALELLRGKIKLSIELKQFGSLYPGLEELTIAMLRKMDMIDQVYLLSFDHYSIRKARQLDRDVELGINMLGASPYLFKEMNHSNIRYMAVKYEFLTESFVEESLENGVQLITWPVDSVEQFRVVSQFPSVLVTTNELERYKQYIQIYTEIHALEGKKRA